MRGLPAMSHIGRCLLLLTLGSGISAAYAYDGGGGGMGAGPATGDPSATPPQKAKVLADYFADLGGDESGDRAFAARYLLGELRRHTWTYEHAQPGSIADLDARSALTELDARIPHACESALLFQNSAVFCAEMVAELGHAELTDQVVTAASRARTKGEARRFAAAVETLRNTSAEAAKGTNSATAAAVPAVSAPPSPALPTAPVPSP